MNPGESLSLYPPGSRVRVRPARFAAERAEWSAMGYFLRLMGPEGTVVEPDPDRPGLVMVAMPVRARNGLVRTWVVGWEPEDLEMIDEEPRAA
jgi:hypothetical protein